jgi:lipopolysaccharide transport system permease protein
MSDGSSAHKAPVVVIDGGRRWRALDLLDLWRHRELLYTLAWRDVKARYKQTMLGMAWSIVQPALLTAVLTIVLTRLSQTSVGTVPYPLFAYAGFLPWTFFATAVISAAGSVIGSEPLITKVYFPRLAIPFGAVVAALVDLAVAFLFLAMLLVYYRVPPNITWLYLLPITVLITIAAAGVGTFLAALNVAYRDFRYVIPFLIQVWMFATPAIYLQSIAPDRAAWLARLNPLAAPISAFRAALLGQPLPWIDMGWSAGLTLLLFLGGCYYFRRIEDSFADII